MISFLKTMVNVENIIRNTALFRYLAEKSKKIILPGFQGVPLYDVSKFFLNQVRKVGLNDRARSISFSFLTAIPAATIFLCTLITYLPVHKKIIRQLLNLTNDLTPNRNTYVLISNFLNDFLEKPRNGLLSFGFFLALFYASNAMIGLMRSFNKSLIYDNKKNIFQTRWMAIKLTLLVLVLVVGAVTLMVTQNELVKSFFHINNRSSKLLFKTLRWVVIIPMFYFSIAFIYKYGPSVKRRWSLSAPGTLLATFLLILTTLVFSYWVNNFATYNKIYGSIGTILILMVLIYFNSLVLLVGYELNVSIHHLKTIAEERTLEENALLANNQPGGI
jgi:membrane protein